MNRVATIVSIKDGPVAFASVAAAPRAGGSGQGILLLMGPCVPRTR